MPNQYVRSISDNAFTVHNRSMKTNCPTCKGSGLARYGSHCVACMGSGSVVPILATEGRQTYELRDICPRCGSQDTGTLASPLCAHICHACRREYYFTFVSLAVA